MSDNNQSQTGYCYTHDSGFLNEVILQLIIYYRSNIAFDVAKILTWMSSSREMSHLKIVPDT